jgi:hypothetical protein
VNLAYKHLNSKLKIGEFTVAQWAVVFFGVLLTLSWGFYLSPLSGYLTLITAVYIGGLPIALALISSFAEFNAGRFAKSAWRWSLAHGRYSPGPGMGASGYVITPDPRAARTAANLAAPELDLGSLWG